MSTTDSDLVALWSCVVLSHKCCYSTGHRIVLLHVVLEALLFTCISKFLGLEEMLHCCWLSNVALKTAVAGSRVSNLISLNRINPCGRVAPWELSTGVWLRFLKEVIAFMLFGTTPGPSLVYGCK